MKINIAILFITAATHLTAAAQVRIADTVKAGDSSIFTRPETFQKYITRGNFCNIILDDLIFSESIPGKFMLDLSMKFNTDNDKKANTLRVLFEDLIQISEPGTMVKLGRSGDWLATKIPLTNVSEIEIEIRLIPVAEQKYDQVYDLLKPLMGQPIFGVPITLDIGGVIDKFSTIAAAGDKKSQKLYGATIPVPQNIVEAQTIEKNLSRAPLRNNEVIAIAMAGSKEVTDPTVLGKAKDLLNGISSFVAGKNLTPRPTSSFKGMVTLRFTKDFTQPLPESLIGQLKDLSDAADQALTNDTLGQVATKAADAVKAIDAISKSKSKDLDDRADFHLRSYVELTRIWSLYKKATTEGGDAIKASQWRTHFKNWYSKSNIQGLANYTQAYGVSDIYPTGRVAKIFVPYSLSDEMILEMLQRQTSLHQALAEISDLGNAERI